MIEQKNPYWNDHSDAYQYSNSTVLKNLPGITDGAELEALELNATIVRMPEALASIQNKINMKLWQDGCEACKCRKATLYLPTRRM